MTLLRRHAAAACAGPGGPGEHAQQLVALCASDSGLADVTNHDGVRSAVDALLEELERTQPQNQGGATPSLEDLIMRMPVPRQVERPVTPGVHVLTGHAGKGQEFDLVIVVCLEEGKIPDFRVSTPQEIAEELRVLHVMLSRAKNSLMVTRVDHETRTPTWVARATPSRWLRPLAQANAVAPGSVEPQGQ